MFTVQTFRNETDAGVFIQPSPDVVDKIMNPGTSTTAKTEIIFVVDVSGSMGDSIDRASRYSRMARASQTPRKVDIVNSCITHVMKHMNLQHNTGTHNIISLIGFDTDSTVHIKQQELSNENLAKFTKDLKTYTQPRGGTDIHKGLSLAINIMEESEAKYGDYTGQIILISDGYHNSGMSKKELLDMFSDHKYKQSIISIGLGDADKSFDSQLLTSISGTCCEAKTGKIAAEEMIGNALSACYTIAKDMSIVLNPVIDPSHVITSLESEYNSETKTLVLKVGDVDYSQSIPLHVKAHDQTVLTLDYDDVFLKEHTTVSHSILQTPVISDEVGEYNLDRIVQLCYLLLRYTKSHDIEKEDDHKKEIKEVLEMLNDWEPEKRDSHFLGPIWTGLLQTVKDHNDHITSTSFLGMNSGYSGAAKSKARRQCTQLKTTSHTMQVSSQYVDLEDDALLSTYSGGTQRSMSAPSSQRSYSKTKKKVSTQSTNSQSSGGFMSYLGSFVKKSTSSEQTQEDEKSL